MQNLEKYLKPIIATDILSVDLNGTMLEKLIGRQIHF